MKSIKPISKCGVVEARVSQGLLLTILEKELRNLLGTVFGGKEGTVPTD
jgi:hypothetical protein